MESLEEGTIAPYSTDIVEPAAKGSLAYTTHSYHTKVPPEIIQELIEHYTRPGELIIDSFCGSGMSGLAAIRSRRSAILSDLSPYACHIANGFCQYVDVSELRQATSEIVKLIKNDVSSYYLAVFTHH